MSAGINSEELEQFLKKALEIQLADSSAEISEDTLKEIALRAGLSEDDWERVRERLDAHLQRGRNFLQHENYADAIEDLEPAVALAPYRAGVLADCGKAHFGLWKTKKTAGSRERAEELLNKSLEIEPQNSESARVLSEIKETGQTKLLSRKSVYSAAVAAALGVACFIGGKSFSSVQSPEAVSIQQLENPRTTPTTGAAVFQPDGQARYTNSLNMPFVSVPITENDRLISRKLFCVYETRIRDYRRFVESSGYDAVHRTSTGEEFANHWDDPGYPVSDDHPVSFVSWDDANAFCQWLTETERRENRIGPTDTYRLPTDHEWSCAVGIGHIENHLVTPKYKHHRLRDVFPWGAQWPPLSVVGNYYGPEIGATNAGPFESDDQRAAAPVGSYSITHWGMHDLGGNLWEWCSDQWDVDMEEEKTLRGACFKTNNKNHLLSSGRRWVFGHERKEFIGFRIVLDRGESE